MSNFDANSQSSVEPENPFAVSEVQFAAMGDAVDMTNSEQIRTQHLPAEASIRAIGTLQVIAAVMLFLGAVGQIVGGAAGVFEVIIFVLLATLSFFLGRGLRNLKNWARITAAIFTVPAILNPVSWLILYCLLSKKGAFVCTPEYAAIRAATPHLKYKTSIIVKFFVGLLIVVLILVFVTLLLS